MAMSGFQRMSNTNGDEVVHVSWVSGATGAIPTTFIRARGVLSVTRTGTGVTRIVFQRGFTALLNWDINVLQASRSTTGAWAAKLNAEDVAGTTKSVDVEFSTVAGAAVDATTGDVVRCSFVVKKTPGLA